MKARHLLLLLLVAAVSFVLAPTAAMATSTVDGVSCVTSANCVGVGSSDASGQTRAQVFNWNGTAWASSTTPSPSETELSQLAGVSCRSASDCMAVGKYAGTADIDQPLAMRWDGSAWAVTSLPMPGGAVIGDLAAVSCPPSSAKCKATGSYVDGSGSKQPLVLRWDGSTWQADTMPLPAGAKSGEVSGVMCKLETFCQAVGSYVAAAGETKPFAARWNGSLWAVDSVPIPAGATYGKLSGVSCDSTTSCAAIGTFVDSSGIEQPLGAKWNGSSWSNSAIPVPGGATSSSLSGVSCVTANVCSAVGEYEIGSDAFPLAVRWNGTSWSQEPIDAETYGAVATVLRSVSCLSTTFCHATGSITYGHAATPRQLAYRYDGTTWALTESGNYQRTWSAFDELSHVAQDVADSRADLSCVSATSCVRVGSFIHDEVESSRVRSWNGSTWSTASLPSPSEAAETALRGVKCLSATDCRAVGSYVDGAGVRKTLALAWNGTSWSVVTTPNPSGATSSELTSISCTATTFCRAVGSYVDFAGVRKTLALAWNGAAWSTATTTDPSGATSSELTSISCTATTFCRAVGSYVDFAGVRKTLALAWNGTAWSIATTPNPSGAKSGELRSVTCTLPLFCFAVGDYVNSSGETRTQAMKFDGTSWASVPTTDLAGATASVLSDLYCSSLTACLAVGEYTSGGAAGALTMSFQLTGSTWSSSAGKLAVPTGSSSSALSGLSCVSATACVAVGGVIMGSRATTELAESFNGSTWTKTDPQKTLAAWNGVSCRSTDPCVAVGSSTVGESRTQRAARLGDSGWEDMKLPSLSQATLMDVSCTGPGECTAVGSQGSSALSLAERWDGSQWLTQTTPNPVGGSSVVLNGVSCASAGMCMAAGSFANATKPVNPLVERWNGTSWTIETIPTPSGAAQAWLEAVSCASTTLCTAVGDFQDSSGVRHGLIERWNGTSWAIQTPPEPAGATRVDLNGISCKAAACTAVGAYWTASGRYTHVLRWDGSSWSIQSSPNPETSKGNALTDVTCFTATRCLASGVSEPTSTAPDPYPMALGWDGTSWSLESMSVDGGATTGALNDASCVATADCVSVGTASTGAGAYSEPFSTRSTEPTPPPAEVTAIPSGEEFALTPEQEVAAITILKEDPEFQAALGGAGFSAEVIPWLETTGGGSDVLIGAVVDITLTASRASWGEWWSWPAAEYEGFYESGTYSAETVEASASGVSELSASLDAVLDSSGQFLDGDLAQLEPIEGKNATVTMAPSEPKDNSGL